MSNYSDDLINKVWSKGREIPGKPIDEYRLDAAGALMKRSHRGTDDNYDWEIDHVLPKSIMEKLGIPECEWDKPANLRPFNAKNNRKKSDDYPEYTRKLVYNAEADVNVVSERKMEVNKTRQLRIRLAYNIRKQ